MESLIDQTISKISNEIKEYSATDFASSDDPRWCPGCGDYSIYAQMKKVLAGLKIPREKFAFISGIGCSSRFPYYIEAYGLHGIHGRALAIASGLKIARPDLSVWVATGDGDCMSIGGNHMIHALRRNLDINILMFNNEIYGLTKGQYSPTSHSGQITKSSPLGVLDEPFNPASLALGASATFVARTFDKDPKHMAYIFDEAAKHKGISFVEIYQNCLIFNDAAFDYFTRKEHRKEHVLYLEHGKPLIFGEKDDKGIIMDGSSPKVVSITDGKYSANDLIVHDIRHPFLSFILAEMTFNPEFPKPVGIFRQIEKETYEDRVTAQVEREQLKFKEGDLELLMRGNEFWEIK